jgi:hypothetical protein
MLRVRKGEKGYRGDKRREKEEGKPRKVRRDKKRYIHLSSKNFFP